MDGKVTLDHFPEPPQKLNNLWLGEGEETEVFLKYARVLNNAVCLSSVAVHEKIMPNYNPSVIFHGCVNQYIGPLQAEDGVQPPFAQLYVLHSTLERTIRRSNMIMPNDK